MSQGRAKDFGHVQAEMAQNLKKPKVVVKKSIV